ncbi:hypothetical protein KPL71_008037 [Citrus sinensis]|uniref:Uncharacterized protein n=1 Tax=Citrus sinensis TaxID=2711 RepID=A0ACB8M3V4_CITSI|nr:hypothetical protein KPL71_008037 [Citrus sinensis]
MTEHTNGFQGLVDQLTTMKIILDDELQPLLLLSSLPDSWETLMVSVNILVPNGKLDDNGYTNQFSEGKWKLTKGSPVLAKGRKIVGDAEKSDESQSSLQIPIILTSVSSPVAHDDHGGAVEDNNDDGGEPKYFEEVMSHQHKNEWVKAIQEEMKSLNENHTYDIVKLPKGKRALKNKWVYRLKTENKSQQQYKARLVVKDFSLKKCVDFEEIFSPMMKTSSIRVVLGLVASEIEQFDVMKVFLHGDLDEEIYIEQPEGFNIKGKEELVCKLKKSLYGLKQAPRQWYKKFDSFMENLGFNEIMYDYCVFVKKLKYKCAT